jgi:non-heme chloroperoxidase
MIAKPLLLAVGIPCLTALALVAAAVAFGGPDTPEPMHSVNDPFKAVDFSDLPPLERYIARDGARLGYRAYRAAAESPLGSVTLVHGSSASSNSMHPLAQAFARAGYTVYALDVRGHGGSGPKGRIAYVGQLEDDLEDFVKAADPKAPATLAGFSAGGGFVLRVAGGPKQPHFQNYLLLSPFLGQDAPTYRPNSGGWVKVGLPRIFALSALNALGLTQYNDLPVTRFALSPEAARMLTPQYSYALAINFRPPSDYMSTLRQLRRPAQLLAGKLDEAFYVDRFASVFEAADNPIPVTLMPGVGHIGITLDAQAHAAAIKAVQSMRR